jgi:putative spermidine/putrescine transport system permease protein
VLFFLLSPLLAIVPLSFSASSLLVYPLPGLSLRWYREVFHSREWISALQNSLIVGLSTTALAMLLGVPAAIGLTFGRSRLKPVAMGVILLPLIVPPIITAVGIYFFFVRFDLTGSYLGVVLAHTTLAAPLVVIVVLATLAGFDRNLYRASASLGAGPLRTCFKVVLPLIAPGLVSGALFAFATSLDEVVVAYFVAGSARRTLPIQMFNGIRENVTPTVPAVATLLILASIVLLMFGELLRRRNESRTRQPTGGDLGL